MTGDPLPLRDTPPDLRDYRLKYLATRKVNVTTKGFVYTLTDPRDGSIRYVGQTKQQLLERLAGHLASASNPAMRVWLNALAIQGLTPQIDAIATVPVDRLDAEEERQIRRHVAEGRRLFNAPHYHRNMADLYRGTAPTPSALHHDAPPPDKVHEFAHQAYGLIAAARAAGTLSAGQVAARVAVRAPVVALVIAWQLLASIPLVRRAAFTGLFGYWLWGIGFDHLAKDKILPHLPLAEAAALWHEYFARPALIAGLSASGAALLGSLMLYSTVARAASPSATERRPTPRPRDEEDAEERALLAAAVLDAALLHQQATETGRH